MRRQPAMRGVETLLRRVIADETAREAERIVRIELERVGHLYDRPTISDPPGRGV